MTQLHHRVHELSQGAGKPFFTHRRLVQWGDSLAEGRNIMAKLKADHSIESVPEESAVGDSQGNGLSEHAVREIKAKARTIKAATEALHGTTIGMRHPCLPWLV